MSVEAERPVKSYAPARVPEAEKDFYAEDEKGAYQRARVLLPCLLTTRCTDDDDKRCT